jgi:ribonuclease E
VASAEPAEIAAPVVSAAPAEIPAPVAPSPAALEQVVSQAGLEWVQTQTSAAPADIAVTEPPPPRLGRVRRQRSLATSEPMQQIETRPEDRGQA